MKLTKAQQNAFWRHYAGAWAARAAAAGIDPGDRAASDRWRRQLIFAETGRRSLAEVSRTRGFDRLLQRVCMEAGHYARAAEVELSRMRRIRERAEDCLRQVCEILGRPALATARERWGYINAVTTRALGTPEWEDIAEDDLEKVFQILDTHRRRLLRRAGWGRDRGDPSYPMGYRHGRRYIATRSGVELAPAPHPEREEARHAG